MTFREMSLRVAIQMALLVERFMMPMGVDTLLKMLTLMALQRRVAVLFMTLQEGKSVPNS